MVKPAVGFHCRVQRFPPGMAESGVAEIMRQTQRLGQILVEAERAADRTRNLRDLDRMGQAGAVIIPFVENKHLGFVLQPAEC